MRSPSVLRRLAFAVLAASATLSFASASDVLSSSGFTNCAQNPDIKVNDANVTFDRSTGEVKFVVSGTSNKEQNVNASLVVMAYGQQVYSKDFDPCDEPVIDQLCPGILLVPQSFPVC